MAASNIVLKFAVLVALVVEYGSARDCRFCMFLHMRYSGMPQIEGMDWDSILPSSVPGMNDTACYDGTSTETMPCGDNPCTLTDLQVDISASTPIGQDQTASYSTTMTMVMRMCGQAGSTGCTPITMDTKVGPPQPPNNEQSTLRDQISQMVQNANMSITPTISGQQCACANGDGCNKEPSAMSLVEMTTTKAPVTTTGPTTGAGSLRAAIYTVLIIPFVAMFS
ncbi:uncharacterized protein LOC106168801 [Lingula anatina]|uniref:Uncharacterized protein LOC106168801 n=1 Tax=Lingula anatina TaxID=7574 RepID=A0A1S3IZ19_LINAN|nr:uncharacterized protein LOC106168801 [Lingula anatina]|eukprot:XP_013403447.1 uncharacterized protein LOC106168801 [Lingula anatina]